MSASRVRREEPPSSSVMVSPMSVDAWRSCEVKGVVVAVARVARGLQRRSSECVSDMAGCVVKTDLCCMCCCLRDGKVSNVEKLPEHGPDEGIRSLDRVTILNYVQIYTRKTPCFHQYVSNNQQMQYTCKSSVSFYTATRLAFSSYCIITPQLPLHQEPLPKSHSSTPFVLHGTYHLM
jgi:hypothetical protein